MKIDNLIIGNGGLGYVLMDKLQHQHTLMVMPGMGSYFDAVPSQTQMAQGVLHTGVRYMLEGSADMNAGLDGAATEWRDLSCAISQQNSYHGQQSAAMQVLTPEPHAELAARVGGHLIFAATPLACVRRGTTQACVSEIVLDTESWLGWYYWHYRKRFIAGGPEHVEQRQGYPVHLVYRGVTVTPRRIFIACGVGNASMAQALVHDWGPTPLQQERPGVQFYLESLDLPPFDGYIMGTDRKLALVVTHRQGPLGHTQWILGGPLTEARPGDTPALAWSRILEQLYLYFRLDFTTMRRHQRPFIRAEGFNDGQRPSSWMIRVAKNVVVGWPTKLVWAPQCADEMIREVA